MRTAAILLTILAFFSCLAAGFYLTSQGLPEAFVSGQISPTPSAVAAPFVPELQNNVIVVQTDNLLLAQPQLASIWGAFITIQDPPSLKVLRLYPSGDETTDQIVQSAFSLSAEKVPQPAFERTIQTQFKLAYQYYFLIDERGSAGINDWMAANGWTVTLSTDASDVNASLFKGMCSLLKLPDSSPTTSFDWQIIFPDHAYTNIPLQVAAYNSAHLRSHSDQLDCEVINPSSGQ